MAAFAIAATFIFFLRGGRERFDKWRFTSSNGGSLLSGGGAGSAPSVGGGLASSSSGGGYGSSSSGGYGSVQ